MHSCLHDRWLELLVEIHWHHVLLSTILILHLEFSLRQFKEGKILSTNFRVLDSCLQAPLQSFHIQLSSSHILSSALVRKVLITAGLWVSMISYQYFWLLLVGLLWFLSALLGQQDSLKFLHCFLLQWTPFSSQTKTLTHVYDWALQFDLMLLVFFTRINFWVFRTCFKIFLIPFRVH